MAYTGYWMDVSTVFANGRHSIDRDACYVANGEHRQIQLTLWFDCFGFTAVVASGSYSHSTNLSLSLSTIDPSFHFVLQRLPFRFVWVRRWLPSAILKYSPSLEFYRIDLESNRTTTTAENDPLDFLPVYKESLDLIRSKKQGKSKWKVGHCLLVESISQFSPSFFLSWDRLFDSKRDEGEMLSAWHDPATFQSVNYQLEKIVIVIRLSAKWSSNGAAINRDGSHGRTEGNSAARQPRINQSNQKGGGEIKKKKRIEKE